MSTRKKKQTFEDFVLAANGAATEGELFGLLEKALARHGYDRVIFSILRDIDLGPEYHGHGLIQNYPADWHRHYMDSGYLEIDPVRVYVAQTDRAFAWHTLDERLGGLTVMQQRCLNEAAEVGIRNGICVPTVNTPSRLTGVAVATTERHDAAHIDTDLLEAYCNQFYKSFKRLVLRTARLAPALNVTLSPREREVLHWLALGKSDAEIGEILSLNIGTIRFHSGALFRKLDVHSRAHAVLKAVRLGLLDPMLAERAAPTL